MKPTYPYVVKPGDWLAKIAEEHGTTVSEIRNHPDNAEHVRQRPDPNKIDTVRASGSGSEPELDHPVNNQLRNLARTLENKRTNPLKAFLTEADRVNIRDSSQPAIAQRSSTTRTQGPLAGQFMRGVVMQDAKKLRDVGFTRAEISQLLGTVISVDDLS